MKEQTIQIKAPNIQTATFTIEGTAPLVINKFSQKAREMMREKMEQGAKAKKGHAREARNFEENYQQAMHISTEGWQGIPASAFRAAMVSACRLVGFKMTHAKLSVFVDADGFDRDEGTPLVKITKGEPRVLEMTARNATGVADIRVRPMWERWEAVVRVSYDADMFSTQDVTNLLMRVGRQVGIGEGRPDSKSSTGMGWGTFRIKGGDQ